MTAAPEEVLAGSGCVGADCLLRVLANYSRSQEVKTAITVGVVGERGFRTPPLQRLGIPLTPISPLISHPFDPQLPPVPHSPLL